MGMYTITRNMQANPDAIWTVLDDFGNIADWSGGVASSETTNGIVRGVGAERLCNFDAKGKSWARERITDRTDDQLHITIFETNAPMKRFEVDITVHPAAKGSKVTFAMDIAVKGGVLGSIMEKLVVAKQLRKQVNQLLVDLDEHAMTVVAQ